MAKALLTLYVASVLALLLAAWRILHLYCESFGCMGLGVAWFAWAVAYFVVLGFGLLARRHAALPPGLTRVGKGAWWLQLVAGAALAAVWAVRNAA